MRKWWLPVAAVLVVVLATAVVLILEARNEEAADPEAQLVARVVDEYGDPVAGVEVSLGTGETVTTGADGELRAPLPGGAQLVTVAADGYLDRTQAVAPGNPTEVRLTSRAEETVSIRFGGDTMFGRRFYDADDDGDRRDGLLTDGASAEEHAELLAPVRPLLENADLTVVNLETPLAPEPWVDPTAPRPAGFHPTKEYVFASAPAAVAALAESGVDVVSLGNNHVYDALGGGLETALDVLDEAGIARFGAGRTVDEAWAPAVVERKGQRIAFLGCTTITGTEHAVPYVADETQGGAARCTEERLRLEVAAARARADVVVVMIHGGEEYNPEQTEVVRRLSTVAEEAGAAIVADGHPHVVGGIDLADGTLLAESLGNLLFDQTVWPTFLSYLLRVDVRDGAPVLATVDPLFIDDYVPRPTVGVLADAAARAAAGLSPETPVRLQPPGAVFTAAEPRTPRRVEQPLPAGTVARLAPGWWVDRPGAPGDDAVRLGVDLLWTGSFEDMDTDPATEGAHGWALGSHAEVTASAACAGTVGAELVRSPVSTEDVIVTPEHRQLVSPGTELALLADVRDASPGSTLELRWYPDTRGPSSSVTAVEIPTAPAADGECRRVRIDATVPEGIVAVQPVVRLAPTGDVHRGARLAVDNVALVAWGAAEEDGRRFDVVEAQEDTVLSLVDDTELPGTPFAHRPAP